MKNRDNGIVFEQWNWPICINIEKVANGGFKRRISKNVTGN
jgi:hypothetical protein